MDTKTLRFWAVRWMYGVAAIHFLVGVLLPWVADLPVFESYHRGIEASLWGGLAPAAARVQQVWWMSLFGPTVQSLSVWMAALIRVGDRNQSSFAWAALIIGVLLWAPQDILVSLRADAWTHVWIDCPALATMLPPLTGLWVHDRSAALMRRPAPGISAEVAS